MHKLILTNRELLMNTTEAFEELKLILKNNKDINVQELLQEISDNLQTLCDHYDQNS